MEINQKAGILITQLEGSEIQVQSIVEPADPPISVMDYCGVVLEGLASELGRALKLPDKECLTVMSEMITAVLESKDEEETE
jgi:hypothetical protein